ncbi:MAG: hypothetical protein COW55_09020 [Rhodobacteraceae bacterium CG17_big_fil_post_rev_8_21_14_2_50_65_11]|nr:MAG: hypothetical protein COW55_09020 [Rhodobacteraceae bacterium CG17_big_fil_post_rev_8_21_14_2_50_65_11]
MTDGCPGAIAFEDSARGSCPFPVAPTAGAFRSRLGRARPRLHRRAVSGGMALLFLSMYRSEKAMGTSIFDHFLGRAAMRLA